MLPREHRVRTWFFTSRRKPGFVIQKKEYTIKVYPKKGPVEVAVVIPKKVEKTAVSRNSLKRRIYNTFQSQIVNMTPAVYVVYVNKNTEDILSSLSETIQENFLDK